MSFVYTVFIGSHSEQVNSRPEHSRSGVRTFVNGIELPGSLRTIGTNAFCGCSSLTGIAIPNGTTTISSSAFEECTGLLSIVIPESVTKMGEMVFYHCDLDLNVWVQKDSYADEWCKNNAMHRTYMDGSVPADQDE